ncbi:DUF3617 domain-containing protein [Sphingomonas sp. LB-2]|uniref:DUF3617 domain-containing protein n=1 Tax=Sphingomonas caeni TaxID=2984949 RepID=UPI0022313D74|nr:DUF3617 domain-containing protein [Sphingomonas caeni]MCW3846161.1 DUF3617 domain-containing protein [Sphingomonas caeni]
MRITLLIAAALPLAACNQASVTLTNASPEEVAKAASDSGIHFNPGKWETTIEVTDAQLPEMPNMPKGMGDLMLARMKEPQKHSYCMSAEEAAKPGGNFLTGDARSKCTVEKFSMNGGHIEQTVSCPDRNGKEGMRMVTSGTYTGDSMTGTADMQMGGPAPMKIKANISSRRIGDCAAGEK